GCDDGGSVSERSCDVVAPGFRRIALNGMSLNGVSVNGMSLNGISTNGVSLNGDEANGVSVNGVSLNGAERNGVSLNGRSLNGKSLNGKGMNGVSLNGVSVNGTKLGADVELSGTQLVGTDADGQPIVGAAWVGAILEASVGDERIALRITAVERDAEDASIEWYSLEYHGASLCADGGHGLFLAGVWDETGARHDALAGDAEIAYSFSCSNGALAKCVDWGYAPDAVGADAHQSCTRMVRADYCGDGQAHTADGTLIDVFDTLDVQRSDTSVDLAFEAGWGPNGAVCVSRARYTEVGTDGDEIAVSCWEELPACETADEAIAAGAELMNRSAELTLCYE
ncbi:MAG: pentapeptide repeat-containing protein, partial [Deltaproteobacteria bacterium]|nr:pentapeptide repeat-containing protein [Nannocystaceae bacterium]